MGLRGARNMQLDAVFKTWLIFRSVSDPFLCVKSFSREPEDPKQIGTEYLFT